MAAYADYTFYTETYCGSAVPEKDWPYASRRASALIDQMTGEDDRAAPEKRRKKKRRDGYSSRSSCLPEGERTVSQKNGTPFRIKANALLCARVIIWSKGIVPGSMGRSTLSAIWPRNTTTC